MKITKYDPSKVRLPVNTHVPGDVYKITENTAKAIINPSPGEIRIPYAKREEKGDFRILMDSLVRKTDTRKLRFVNVGSIDVLQEMGLVPDDARTINDVLVGFSEDSEVWLNDRGEPKGRVKSLVGYWTVGLSPDDPCPHKDCDDPLYTNDVQTELWCTEHGLIGPCR